MARSVLDDFAAAQGFALDPFQVEACRAVESGQGVLVAAPTGAGKTIVGEFAVALGLDTGRKTFYTTPIKALSNQKYHDLVARHGTDNVGLLTGDTSHNGEAPVVVMTTEVLRNMLYAGSSTLDGLGYVVMDEVHYLADRFRGPVWEEVIILLPESVQVVSLSATVSNAEEFGDWLGEVRGNTAVIVSEHRPVPLWQHLLVGDTMFDLFAGVDDQNILAGPDSTPSSPSTPTSMSTGEAARGPARINPELLHAIRRQERSGAWVRETGRGRGDQSRSGDRGRGHSDRGRGHSGRGADRDRRGRGIPMDRTGPPRDGSHGSGGGSAGGRRGGGASRTEVVLELDRSGLLPAITFIFSRVGCEGAVSQLLSAGVRLIPEQEGRRIRRLVEERVGHLSDGELGVLGYWDFVEGLSRGFAAHHAGMLPLFREIVEELFTQGRIRSVYATETLALGINMPARTVVLEKLVKFNGEAHVEITPAEYTQLTGRAGRRGIDIEGHAVVQWARGMDPYAVGGLASTRTYPLRSSFRPTYNMAVNLVERVGRQVARDILETSFAQFQADRGVVGLATAIRRNEEALEGYAEPMTCHLGDFAEYAELRRALADAEKDGKRQKAASRRAEAAVSMEELRIGDVFRIGAGRRAGWAVVIQPARTFKGEWSGPVVVTEDKHLHTVSLNDVTGPVSAVTRIRVPAHLNPKNPKARRDLATSLRIAVPHDEPYPGGGERRRGDGARGGGRDGGRGGDRQQERVEDLRRRLKAHPCHQCPEREDHARWAERWWRLKRETVGLQRKVEGRTNTVARTFDRICGVLVELGYLSPDGEQVTGDGERLRRLYTEKDLLMAQALKSGTFRRLDAAGLAAVVSAFVFEPRGDATDVAPRLPNDEVAAALTELQRLWSNLEDLETAQGVSVTGAPDAGMAWPMHRWASGRPLDEVLRGESMAAGDFVRRSKQVVDLLDQVANAAEDTELRRTARRAINGVLRGVVATDRLD